MLIATYVSAALIVAASLLIGRATLHALGRNEPSAAEPAVGLAVLLTISSLLPRVPGRATTTLIVLAIFAVASLLYLGASRRRPHGPVGLGLLVALLALALASIPFIVAGHIGVLGIGVNNDLGLHLDMAAWIEDPIGRSPTEFKTGYPIGPHGLVAAIATGIGAEPLDPMMGLILAVPVLTAISVLPLLRELPPVSKVIAALLTALPYLLASTLAVGGFKETTMALLVLGFAFALRDLSHANGDRRAFLVAFGLIAVGMFAVYTYPGIAYALALVGIWAALEFLAARRRGEADEMLAQARRAGPLALVPLGLIGVVALININRIREFTDAVDVVVNAPSRLDEAVSPLESLGVWPSGDYLEGVPGLDAWWLFGAIGLIALAVGIAAAIRRDERALLAGLAGAAAVYLGMLIIGGFYVQAKALVIVAPLATLISLWGLLREPTALRTALAIAFIGLGAYSSFLALRDARVAPDAYAAAQLGEFRDQVRGTNVLSLTSDRFSDYYLRGSDTYGPGKYAEEQIRPRAGKLERFPVDFDSVEDGALDFFDYAVTTKAAYKSAAPPSFEPVDETESFVLWKRTGRTLKIGILPEEERPGSLLDCKREKLREEVLKPALRQRYTTALVQPTSVVGKRLNWENESGDRDSIVENGETVAQTLELPPGTWQLSIQYYSPILDLTIEAGDLSATLAASADGGIRLRTDQGPFWPVGEVISTGAPLEVRVSAGGRSRLQKLLGVDQPAEIGNITAAQPAAAREIPLARACGEYVDHYFANRPAAESGK